MEKVDSSTIFSKMLDVSIEAAAQALFLLVPEPPSLEPLLPDFSNVEEGDHLFYKTPFGMNVHFYVTANLGNGNIEVYGRFCNGNDDSYVEQKFFSERLSASSLKLEKRVLDVAALEEPGRMKKQLHEATDIAKEKQRLKEYKTQRTLYAFLSNNSEHFVTFVKTGTATCEIAEEFKKALLKHVTAQVTNHGGIEALKAAIKDGNWSAMIVVLKKLNVISAEAKTTVTIVAEDIAETAAVQTTRSAAKTGTVQVAKTGTIQVAKKAAKAAVKKSIKGTILVQVAFEGAIYTVCMSRAFYKYVNGHMGKKEFIDYAVKRSATSVGSLAGGIGGSIAGIAAGAAIGSVVPVIGTAIGGAVGGFVGGVGGGLGGTALGRLTGNLINWLRK